MSHFNKEFIKFFKELSANNSTEWFNENRKTYEQEVKKPFAAFTELMIERIGKHERDINIKPSDAISRINKDIRFSKDKTPYNTHLSANISPYGKKDKAYPGFYFQLGPKSIEIYGGAYMPEKEQLQAIRRNIAVNLKKFETIISDASFKKHYGTVQGEVQKRLDPEFKDLAEKHPLIANKQFYYAAQLDASLILKDELPDKLMEYYLAGKPLNEFLRMAFKN